MAKELPYFKFEPAEYLTKDVSFCSLSAQGLFINLCSYYWQRGCNLSKEQFLRRLNYENELNELIDEGVVDIEENNIKIKFLDFQFSDASKSSKVNSINGSKGGRPRKTTVENPIESETKAKLNPIESETKGIREDKIREDKIIEDNLKEKIKIPISKNEIYSKEILESQMWVETISMQNKITPEEIPKWILEFNQKLISELDNKISKKEYAAHFSRWLPGEILKSKNQNQNGKQFAARGIPVTGSRNR